VLEFLIPYLAIIAYLIIPTSDHSFTLVLLSDILSILHLLHGQAWDIHQDELCLTLQGAARLAPINPNALSGPQ
jgi:hypothetical protein